MKPQTLVYIAQWERRILSDGLDKIMNIKENQHKK